jgi:maltose alpha-D-glucosyltransferase/alpha-amylase
MEFVRSSNPKVLAFVRKYEDSRILVVANLSRFVQFAELELQEYAGIVPEEVFGRTPFPRIGESSYSLSLGPHGFYWFSLPVPEAPRPDVVVGAGGTSAAASIPMLPSERPIAERFVRAFWDELEAVLPAYLSRYRTISGSMNVSAARILQAYPFSPGEGNVWLLFLRVESREVAPEMMTLALAFVPDDGLPELLLPLSEAGLARVPGPVPGVLCDAMTVPWCARAVLRAILSGRTRLVNGAELISSPLTRTSREEIDAIETMPVTIIPIDRNNLSVVFGQSYLLKVFRRLEESMNPDLEIGRYLAPQTNYTGCAPVIGYIEYRRRGGADPTTISVLHRYISNNGTAWQFTQDELSRYFERVAALPREQPPQPPAPVPLIGSIPSDSAEGKWPELAGGFLENVRLLGRRAAEMHLALTANRLPMEFAPEPFGKLLQRSMYQSMRNLTGRLARRLSQDTRALPEPARAMAARLLKLEDAILRRFRSVQLSGIGGCAIRCHGDFHLGHLLYTGKDFVVADFVGEVARTVGERKVKRSPLRDVAVMIRSFDYCLQSVLLGLTSSKGRPQGMIRAEDQPILAPWVEIWYNRVSREFVSSYINSMGVTDLLPPAEESRRALLDILLLERALQEADLELSTRPHWAIIPLRGAVQLLESSATANT